MGLMLFCHVYTVVYEVHKLKNSAIIPCGIYSIVYFFYSPLEFYLILAFCMLTSTSCMLDITTH